MTDEAKKFLEDYETKLIEKLDERFGVPFDYMAASIITWVMEGHKPGDFLWNVLNNDFMGAFMHGDPTNRLRMHVFAQILRHDIPFECRGTTERTNDWVATGGLRGRWSSK